MFTKNCLSAILAFGMLSLTACGGENTFKRESNPTAGYEPVVDRSQPSDPALYAEQERKRQADALKECGNPFTLTIEGENGKVATFEEDKEKTITIKVASTLDESMPWDLKLDVAPCKDASCFKQVSKTQQEGVYSFTYKPAKLELKNDQAFDFVTFKYEWNLENKCTVNTTITETVSLIVNRVKTAAEVKQDKEAKAASAKQEQATDIPTPEKVPVPTPNPRKAKGA